jgi:hypothetical protein
MRDFGQPELWGKLNYDSEINHSACVSEHAFVNGHSSPDITCKTLVLAHVRMRSEIRVVLEVDQREGERGMRLM